MMFLEENPKSMFETIAYNDSEYLDEYESYNGFFVRFINSGLPTLANMSFDELLKLPNHLADWVVEWATKQSLRSSSDNENALKDLEKEMLQAAKQDKTSARRDPFSGKY